MKEKNNPVVEYQRRRDQRIAERKASDHSVEDFRKRRALRLAEKAEKRERKKKG